MADGLRGRIGLLAALLVVAGCASDGTDTTSIERPRPPSGQAHPPGVSAEEGARMAPPSAGAAVGGAK